MTWLIILGVLLVMISPALCLRPSPRERRVAALRKAAMAAGIKVQLAAPPLHDGPRLMPRYGWEYPNDYPGPRFVLVRDQEAGNVLEPYRSGWRWRVEPLHHLPEGVDQRLGLLLERLPEDALVIESDRDAITLWWSESLGRDAFSDYLADFAYLKKHLAGRPDQPTPRLKSIRELRDLQ
ncbi:preprotein translocase subunit YajC [Pistricoccus aurantiacus]|uniref:preprotein translocase subunit YajC n=1 Tax=Pistricoccus aurantiacus TaxID=1883414 RepID=UPI0036283D34